MTFQSQSFLWKFSTKYFCCTKKIPWGQNARLDRNHSCFSAMERSCPQFPLSLDPHPFSLSRMGKVNDPMFTTCFSHHHSFLRSFSGFISSKAPEEFSVAASLLCSDPGYSNYQLLAHCRAIPGYSANIHSVVVNIKPVNTAAGARNHVLCNP